MAQKKVFCEEILDSHVPHADYRKFFYWLAPSSIDPVLKTLEIEKSSSRLYKPRERPCEGLHHSKELSLVPPEAWNLRCLRQGSWYRTSDLAGDYLLLSNDRLNAIEGLAKFWGKLAVIRPLSKIKSINPESYERFRNLPAYRAREPPEWPHLLAHEGPLFRGFIERYHLDISLEKFTGQHSANHANFLAPPDQQHTLTFQNRRVPCSLFGSNYVCSACVELFGMIGRQNREMALKKCPGLKYIHTEPEQFILTTLSDQR